MVDDALAIDYKSKIQALYPCDCPYYEQCKRNVSYGNDTVICKFRFDRAKVGDNYGKEKTIPRIVMVGIEGFSDSVVVTEVVSPSTTVTNAHYNGVKYVLAYLLSDFMGKEKPEPKIKRDGVYWIKDALTRYCLCNLYRCAFVPKTRPDKKSGLHHTKEMRRNCFGLLLNEIKALDPDVVVVQATDFRVLPEKNIEKLLSEFECNREQYGKDKYARLYTGHLNKHEIHIAQTRHGADRIFKTLPYIENELNPLLDEIVKRVKNNHTF